MTWVDYFILAVVFAAFVFALLFTVRRRKNGCCGCCSGKCSCCRKEKNRIRTQKKHGDVPLVSEQTKNRSKEDV